VWYRPSPYRFWISLQYRALGHRRGARDVCWPTPKTRCWYSGARRRAADALPTFDAPFVRAVYTVRLGGKLVVRGVGRV